MTRTLNCVKSLVICKAVPPRAMPEQSAICSSGQEPSIAAAESSTAISIAFAAIFLMARTARHPGVSAVPRPPSGKIAPGLCHSPSTFAALLYSAGRYHLSQFVDPQNCWMCNFSRRGAKSLIACTASPSGRVPLRDTKCPNSLPSVTATDALSTPYEKPA